MCKRKIAACLIVLAALTPAAAPVHAQTGVEIAGTVRDASGALVPGVTVEASSPALIEKVRSVVTDDQGNYKILELRPGIYTVTFTLPGFSTVKREGLELTTGFTATVNGEMKLGTLEETVIVSGASPVVDVLNARAQNVMSDELLRTLPAGGRSTDTFATLTLGVRLAGGDSGSGNGAQLDVGGSRGEFGRNLSVQGSRPGDVKRMIDGMTYNNWSSDFGGWAVTFRVSTLGMQEAVVESSGTSEAETNTQINLVPRDGGNRFSVNAIATYSNRNLQADNLNDTLRARGATTGASVRQVWDYGVGVGGPVANDRLWFYSANRYWGAESALPGAFWNTTQGTFNYTPDTDREGYERQSNLDFSGRLSWRAAPKHQIAFLQFINRACACEQNVSATIAPEASLKALSRNSFTQTTWTFPATDRMLFTAGASFGFFPFEREYSERVNAESIALTEQATGVQFNAAQSYGSTQPRTFTQRFGLAYVFAAHAIKTGFSTVQGTQSQVAFANQSLTYQLRLGLPVSLVQWISPFESSSSGRTVGVYAQDQWTLRRLTLNYGVRYDQLSGRTPAIRNPEGLFNPALDFPATSGIPDRRDLSPRVSVAYDVFGNAKTALKASLGRYVRAEGSSLTLAVAPSGQIVRSTNRLWNDSNGNQKPDCDLANPNVNGECGGMANRAFGTPLQTVLAADDVVSGWGSREHNWQSTLALQQELRPGIGLTVGYHRTAYYNMTVTDNRTVTPENYDPYCVTTPVDPRLPGGGGQQLCGFYNLNPSKFGQPANNLITRSSHFPGEQVERYDGVDVELNARFGRRGLLGGGVSSASQQSFNCKIIDSPEQGRPGFCESRQPWSAGTQAKFHGSYPLPWWGVDASGVLQVLPPVQQLATLVVTNAQVAPSLGRNLAGCPAAGACTATVSAPIVAPWTQFEKRATQLDIRLTKVFQVRNARVKGMFDVYNLTNDAAVLNVNTTYGSAWLRPTLIHQGRLFKFGAEINY